MARYVYLSKKIDAYPQKLPNLKNRTREYADNQTSLRTPSGRHRKKMNQSQKKKSTTCEQTDPLIGSFNIQNKTQQTKLVTYLRTKVASGN